MVDQTESILNNIEIQRISSLLNSQGWNVISVDLKGDTIELSISKPKAKESERQ
jgi:hypothetical protein